MDRTQFEPWKFQTTEELRAAIGTLGVDIPVSDDLSVLSEKKNVGGMCLKNALAVHPMEGADGTAAGAPGELTYNRYERYARGGPGLIWVEATSVSADGRSSANQLYLCDETKDEFKRFCDRIHEAGDGVKLVVQLTHSGRFSEVNGKPAPLRMHRNPMLDAKFGVSDDTPLVSDDTLDRIAEDFVHTVRLTEEVGFDGVDIKTCHQYLLSEALSAYEREGKYGGSYENRTALVRNIFKESARELGMHTILATRTALYDHMPYPYGFGTLPDDGAFCPDEGIRLLGELAEYGLSLVSSSVGTDYLEPGINRPCNFPTEPKEHPLVTLERMIAVTAAFKRAHPRLTFLSAGMSYLQHLAPYVSAGVLQNGLADLAGFGRLALADPNFANDILAGRLTPKNACVACGQCLSILCAGMPTGCPVRDPGQYLSVLKKVRAMKGE
jgi:2,4-dienoyl-CoA reductase-like NADH-dependent reductase (Old Yellow Enzyme family)